MRRLIASYREIPPNATVRLAKPTSNLFRARAKTGAKGPIWQRMGAQSVKQYGWYYTMHWRGGKVTNYNADGSVASVECFDVRDTTADRACPR